MLNATNWKELKKQLRQIQGKAVFKLERVNSMNDGTFYRVLHQVKLHELVFFDGKQPVYTGITKKLFFVIPQIAIKNIKIPDQKIRSSENGRSG